MLFNLCYFYLQADTASIMAQLSQDIMKVAATPGYTDIYLIFMKLFYEDD